MISTKALKRQKCSKKYKMGNIKWNFTAKKHFLGISFQLFTDFPENSMETVFWGYKLFLIFNGTHTVKN